MFFIVPCVEEFIKVDLRVLSLDVPPQEVLTKDSVTVQVDAVVYYRIFKPMTSVIRVNLVGLSNNFVKHYKTATVASNSNANL